MSKRKRPSTALAVRPRNKPLRERATRENAKRLHDFGAALGLFPAPGTKPAVEPAVDLNVLGDDAAIGALGLAEIRLTAKEEATLARAVNPEDVEIKPTGQPYLSHPAYTRWFNEAFGRLGWAIVPRSKPLRSGDSVVCPYVLYIHGKPVAFAMGEQLYHESNKEQTYGDALEATVASALRRCAKRLGVGLELWDRRWLRAFMAAHVAKVWLKDKDKPAFRLKTDPRFWNEVAPKGRTEEPMPETQRHGPAAGSTETITDPQRKRLFVILRNSGRDEATVRAWLKARFGYDSTKDITRRDYETICTSIESASPFLPDADAGVEREPGEDD